MRVGGLKGSRVTESSEPSAPNSLQPESLKGYRAIYEIHQT